MFGREDDKMITVFLGVYLALWVAGQTLFPWSVNVIIIVGGILFQSIMLQVARHQRKKLLDNTVNGIEKDTNLDDDSRLHLLHLGLITLLYMRDK